MTIVHDFQIISKLNLSILTLDLVWVVFILKFDRSLQNDLQKFNRIKYLLLDYII